MAVKKLVGIVFLGGFLASSMAGAGPHVDGPDAPVVSIEQVKEAIKKRHEGNIISVEAKPINDHPNCHIVKMATPTGGIKYIRYACK